MDWSDRCRQQRDSETKRLRAFLKVGLLVSAGLHGAGLTFLLLHSDSVVNRSTEVPVEIVTLNPPGTQDQPPSTTSSTDSKATPAPLEYFPSPSHSGDNSALASTSTPSSLSTSRDRPTEDNTSQRPPSTPSDQTTAEPTVTDQTTAVKPPTPSTAKSSPNPIENSQPNLSAPSVMPPTTTASTGTETNSTAAGTNFLQMLRDRLSNAIGTTGSSSGNVAGGTGGQMGLPGAVPNKQPSPSLGLGASSLGGLASRNLENGMATFFANTGKVDRPECLICSKPVYPERAQRSGVTGDVLVGYDLDKNGKVIGTHLLRSSGNAELDRASLAEARNHKFKPMENGYNGFVTRFSYRKGGTSSSVSASPRPAATAPNLLLSAPPKRSRPADGQTSVHELLPEPSPTDASEPPAPERSPAYTPSEPSSTPGVANLERERATAPATNLEIGASADSASPRSNSQ